MIKFLVRLVLLVIVLIVALYFGRNLVARKSVELGVTKLTGFPLTIGSVDANLFQSQLDVRQIQLHNPPGFDEKLFVQMPQLFVDYRFGSMLARSPHINTMKLNIEKLVVVKNDKGLSNVNQLKGVASSGNSRRAETKTPYRVDLLQIHIGTVVVKDFSGRRPSERTLPLNIDATYQNLTDATDITRLVLMTMLGRVRLPELGLSADQLQRDLASATGVAGTAVSGAVDTLGKTSNGLFDAFKKPAK